jgi:methylated-DNA-[protein]-cysteine S-methyltransferase
MAEPITFYSTFKCPMGDYSVQVNEFGAVVGSVLGDHSLLFKRSKINGSRLDPKKTLHVKSQVLAYFNHEIKTFSLKLSLSGTEYQKNVWACIAKLKWGNTSSYGLIAETLKSGPRAVGGATGRNPICIIIPCHRVVGKNGDLTGFAFGEKAKRFLLQLEGISH